VGQGTASLVKVCDLAGFHLHRIWDTRAPVPFFLKNGLRGKPLVKGYALAGFHLHLIFKSL